MSGQHGPIEEGVKHGLVATTFLALGWVVDRAIESQAPGTKSQIGKQVASVIIVAVAGKEALDGLSNGDDHTA